MRNLYAWGEMPEAEYRAKAQRLHAELAEVVEPSPSSMEGVAAALVDASPERQAAVALLMLREIITSNGQVAVFVARAEIKPLLELCVGAAEVRYSA